ncbi:hypothetical protein ABPG72_001783 [Tetrahymena utriculariae]
MNQPLLQKNQITKDDLEKQSSQQQEENIEDEIVYAIIVKNRKKKVVDYAKKNYSLHKFLNYVVKTAPEARRTSFKYKEELIFHVLSEYPYMYLCVTDVQFSIEKAFMFISEIKAHFLEQDVKEFIQDRQGKTKKFQDYIKSQMESYNTTAKTKLEEARQCIVETEQILNENMNKLMEKEDKISSSLKLITESKLEKQSSPLVIDKTINNSFKKLSIIRKQKRSSRNKKLIFISTFFILIIAVIILLYQCGGFQFEACK